MRNHTTAGPVALAFLVLAFVAAGPLVRPALAAQPTAAHYEDGLSAAKRGDYAAALDAWRPLANQGNAKAQFGVGSLYDKGNGVKQNYATAAQWYRRAAEQGYAAAQYRLGAMYARGDGVSQEYRQAYMWYSLAAASGNADAKRDRDDIAQVMTDDEIADGKRMVQDWRDQHAKAGAGN